MLHLHNTAPHKTYSEQIWRINLQPQQSGQKKCSKESHNKLSEAENRNLMLCDQAPLHPSFPAPGFTPITSYKYGKWPRASLLLGVILYFLSTNDV